MSSIKLIKLPLIKCFVFILSFGLSSNLWSEEIWKIASLEWPPFTGKNLPEGGSAVKALRAALKTQGITLQVEYYPWSRAIIMARQPDYIGLFPCWPEDIEVAAKDFEVLPALFHSPIVIAQNKINPLSIKSLADLTGRTIGVVQDYANTTEFNKMVKNKLIKTSISQNDLDGLRALNANRTDGMLIDMHVMNYLLKHELKSATVNIEANSGWQEQKSLHLDIVSSHPKKAYIKEVYARAIATIDAQKIVDDASIGIHKAADESTKQQ